MRYRFLFFLAACCAFPARLPAQDLTSNLFVGARDGQTASVRSLIATGRVRLDAQTQRGWTPTMEAALRNHAEVVRLLLEAGASSELTNEYGETALHLAAYFGSLDAVRVLLEHGADPNRRDEFERTAFTWARWGDNDELVELLRSNGADGTGIEDPFEGDCPPAWRIQEPPDLKKMKKPQFTEGARERVTKGEVELEVLVRRDGRVDPDSIRLSKGLDPELDERLMELVKDYRFEPAKVQGQPVKSLVRVRSVYVPAEKEGRIYIWWNS